MVLFMSMPLRKREIMFITFIEVSEYDQGLQKSQFIYSLSCKIAELTFTGFMCALF